MKLLNLEQQTPEWHEWRAQHIGSSDAPIIMGLGYSGSTVQTLLEEKFIRTRRETTFAMRRGHTEENPARRAVSVALGLEIRPACVEHDTLPWLGASLDGMDFWKEIVVEIKALKAPDHELAKEGKVPPHVWPQLQHQLAVTGCQVCLYASWSTAMRFGGPANPDLAIIEVCPDTDYWLELLTKEEQFWNRLCAARQAPHATHV